MANLIEGGQFSEAPDHKLAPQRKNRGVPNTLFFTCSDFSGYYANSLGWRVDQTTEADHAVLTPDRDQVTAPCSTSHESRVTSHAFSRALLTILRIFWLPTLRALPCATFYPGATSARRDNMASDSRTVFLLTPNLCALTSALPNRKSQELEIDLSPLRTAKVPVLSDSDWRHPQALPKWKKS